MTPFESRKIRDNSNNNIFHATVSGVLGRYWPTLSNEIKIIQLHGGLSGAVLFKISNGNNYYCLKGHFKKKESGRLGLAHASLLKSSLSGLSFLPIPEKASNGNTLINFKGRVWELLKWIPGEPMLEEKKTLSHLISVMEKLRELHEKIAKICHSGKIPMPGWVARIKSISFLEKYLSRGVGFPKHQYLSESLFEIHDLTCWGLKQIIGLQNQTVPVVKSQLCWGDARQDNVHFFGNEFSGFTDFTSMRLDCVDVDLARFLGEFCLENPNWYTVGLSRYGITSLQHETRVLQLDSLGILASLSHWYKWILLNPSGLESPLVKGRLDFLKKRLLKWKGRGNY